MVLIGLLDKPMIDISEGESLCNKRLKMRAEPCEVQNISNPTKIECNERNMGTGLLFKNKVSIIH